MADDALPLQAFLTMLAALALAALAGPLAAAVARWRHGPHDRTAAALGWLVACSLLALGALTATGPMALRAWAFEREAVSAQGEVLGIERGTRRASHLRSEVPVQWLQVRFRSADGRSWQVKGPPEALLHLPPGSPVGVRYRPDDPARARIDGTPPAWSAAAIYAALAALALAGAMRARRAWITARSA